VSERFDISSLEICGDLAVESGEVVTQLETPARLRSTERARYFSVWKRQSDGSWKVGSGLWSNGTAASGYPEPAPPSPPVPEAIPASAASRSPDFVPIPDPRSLSDGFVRTIQDNLNSTAHHLRSLAGSNSEKRRKAAARADRDLQVVIRDVGWIDVGRFGVATSCDAAYVVSQSGDAALMRSALPLMERDLNNSENDPACYRGVVEAYQALPVR
jgi:hypothetical protein